MEENATFRQNVTGLECRELEPGGSGGVKLWLYESESNEPAEEDAGLFTITGLVITASAQANRIR
jgi:hypothetical protein